MRGMVGTVGSMSRPAEPTDPRNHDVVAVERLVPAPAGAIFDLLADPSRHPEIDGSGSVRRATEPSRRLELGDRFGMSMKIGIPYGMVSTVVEFEEDRRIAWQSRPTFWLAAKLVGGRTWRYELEPQEGGTLVRETWDISTERHPAGVRFMRDQTRRAMAATLQRIEQVVAGPPASSGSSSVG